MALRPTTNLTVPEDLMLPRQALKEKFLYVYTKAYTGTPTVFMTKLWAAALFPSVVADPKFGSAKPRFAADELAKSTPSGYLAVRKIKDNADPHFVVSIPLFSFMRQSASGVNTFLNMTMRNWRALKQMPEASDEHHQEVKDFHDRMSASGVEELGDVVIPTQKVIESMKLDLIGQSALKQCLLRVRIQSKGNLSVIFADFKITKEEAQQLTTTHWTELRDIDLYPLLLHWINVGFGARGLAPVASFSVSKIAYSLPETHANEARVNEDGISINPEGRPIFLPRSVEKSQTLAYEDAYIQAGAREDGTFALVDINEGALAMDSGKDVKTRLPRNMVVSVDWLNNKYAYTDTNGMLTVTDLTRFRTADVSHIRTLLEERKVVEETLNWFFNMGMAVGVTAEEFKVIEDDYHDVSEGQRAKLEQVSNDIRKWTAMAVQAAGEDIGLVHLTYADFKTQNGYSAFAPVARWFARAAAAVQNNIGVVYNKYSVSTVSSQFAWLLLIVRYADHIVDIRAKDVAKRKAAIFQGVDPDWKLPSVPLVKKDMGLLPHQTKVQNIMKDDPEVAIMPIQTGGGKTPSLLIDLLLQIKANSSNPYLVLCPSHLVPNYVKETVYFTDGRLNVIALTNTAIRQNGWKRLQQIFEAMPRNTVVVVDLDYCLAFRKRSVSYGTTPTTIFPVIEFLRQFRFGYVAIDEAHRIKGKSARNSSVMALISDIPKKRLASGTFVHDSPSDMARIIGALDPTIFGSRDEFNTKYGEEVRGERVIKWKPGAEVQIMQKIREHIVVAGAMRKEWAAFLPTKVEWTGGVNLLPAQQAVYEDILNETIQQIEEDSKTNAALQKFLKKKNDGPVSGPGAAARNDEEDEDGEREIDEDEGEDMASMLNPYLARLESFLISPGSDVLGKKLLTGEDLLSPKVALVYERIKLHLFGGKTTDGKGNEIPYGPFPGKVLVFCNYDADAKEIFEKAPPELKKLGVLYRASDKVEALAQMEKNPKKMWMVGIVKSMEEGLNLQFASRVVRVSSPWNPGSLEQSNARIERPEFKKKEERQRIFFDTIVANRTYDITKQARLIAKVLAAAKFENADSPAYQEIPDLEIIPMSLDTIREFNTWEGRSPEDPGLVDYMKAQKVYEAVRNKDYADYKAAYIAKHGEGPVMQPVTVAPTPPDARLLKVTPYVPGLGLYKEQDLGLVRIDEYLNVVSTEDDDSDDEAHDVDLEGGDQSAENTELEQKLSALKGQLVHTEFGEGYIRFVSAKSRFMQVELLNGFRVRQLRSQVFLVTRTLTSNKDIKTSIQKEVGLPVAKADISVPADFWKPSSGAQRIQEQKEREIEKSIKHGENKKVELKKQKDKSIELFLFVANGFLGLDYLMDEGNEVAAKMLQASSFRPTQPYYYAKVINYNALNNQMKLWAEKGLMVDKQMMNLGVKEAFIEMYNLLKNGAIKNHKETYRATQQQRMVNFYRMENKPSNEKGTFKPYPILQDGQAFIALPANQASSKLAMKFRRPAFKWTMSDPSLMFFGSMQQIVMKLKELQEDGIHISNIKDLESELHKMRQTKFQIRDPKDGLEIK